MQKGFPRILIALIVVAVGGYFLYQQQTKSTPVTSPAQTAAQPSPTSNETANWLTYSSVEGKFSLKYPSNWELSAVPANVEHKGIVIKGNEGSIQINYGQGFGGACPQGYIKLSIQDGQIDACDTVESDGTEKWSLAIGKKNNIGYEGAATAKSPYSQNREVILKILSTLTFTNSQTSQIFSTEGQSCGRNAGAGGDAQCASGLMCKYKDAQEEKNGIGTCVKE